MIVLLNGIHTKAENIDPKRHRYLGMWRPPINPFKDPDCDILCNCGEILKVKGQETEHYLRGCYDLPQYIDIEERKI